MNKKKHWSLLKVLTMNKLLMTLILASTTAQADWKLDGRTASSEDVSGYGTEASLFIGQDSTVMLGMIMYDTSCKRLTSEIVESAVHEVNGRKFTFQSQCVGYDQRMYMPSHLSGNNLLMDIFKRYDSVSINSVGSNYIFVYKTDNFDDAYSGLSAIADLNVYKF